MNFSICLRNKFLRISYLLGWYQSILFGDLYVTRGILKRCYLGGNKKAAHCELYHRDSVS